MFCTVWISGFKQIVWRRRSFFQVAGVGRLPLSFYTSCGVKVTKKADVFFDFGLLIRFPGRIGKGKTPCRLIPERGFFLLRGSNCSGLFFQGRQPTVFQDGGDALIGRLETNLGKQFERLEKPVVFLKQSFVSFQGCLYGQGFRPGSLVVNESN